MCQERHRNTGVMIQFRTGIRRLSENKLPWESFQTFTAFYCEYFSSTTRIPAQKNYRLLEAFRLINYTSQFDMEYHIHNLHTFEAAGEMGRADRAGQWRSGVLVVLETLGSAAGSNTATNTGVHTCQARRGLGINDPLSDH